jgi:hypothetical protein
MTTAKMIPAIVTIPTIGMSVNIVFAVVLTFAAAVTPAAGRPLILPAILYPSKDFVHLILVCSIRGYQL